MISITDSLINDNYTLCAGQDLQKYDVHFNTLSSVFTSNEHICFNNLFVRGSYIFFSENIAIITQSFFNGGSIARADGVVMFERNELHFHQDLKLRYITIVLSGLKKFILKDKTIFEKYINNKQEKKKVVLQYIPRHIGHDLVDQLFNWSKLCKTFDTLKVYHSCLFFKQQALLKLFKEVNVVDEYTGYVSSCEQNYMMFRIRHGPGTFCNDFIKQLTPRIEIDLNITTVGIFLKEDTVARQCFNSYEFYIQIISFLIKHGFKIKIFGFIRLNYSNSRDEDVYESIATRCKVLGERLIEAFNTGDIIFYNNIPVDDLMNEAPTLTHYITTAGSVQHIAHLFSTNLKKALVVGDADVNFFHNYRRLMRYTSLPKDFLEYYEINGDVIEDCRKKNPRRYNFMVKNLQNLDLFLSEFFNV